jgi:SAM-dependent methyltransferase
MTTQPNSNKDWYFTAQRKSVMGRYTTAFEQRIMTKVLGKVPESLSILDIGGGDGQHSFHVRSLGHEPVLLEYDDAPIQIHLDRGSTIPAIQASGLALPIAGGTFDAVMTIEVSVCFTGLGDANVGFFADVHRVLRPGGLFLLTAFNRDSYINPLKKLKKNRPDWEEMYYLEGLGDYQRKLGDAGFEVEHCWGYRWLPFTRQSNNRLIPLLARLERLLFLRNLPRFSPWLFFVARKKA